MPRSGPFAFALVLAAVSVASADPSSAKKHPSVVQVLDDVLAAKCSAFTNTDCAHSVKPSAVKPARAHLFEQLGGKTEKLELPKDARRDATAGVFI